jgi:ubiquinone/menaquinone biosynthesis C-methylase UbiE
MVVDISFSQTQSAKRRGVTAVQADALRLPFRDHVFDFVIAYGSLHHTPSCHLGLAEAIRVGTEKSRIFFSVYNRHHIYFWLYHSLGKFCQNHWNSGRTFMVQLIFRLWFIPMLWIFRCLQQRAIARFSTKYAWRFFADQYLTPRATFHDLLEFMTLASYFGLRIEKSRYDHAGQMVSVLYGR